MKIDIQDSTTATWIILAIVMVVAVTYSIIAFRNQPPQRSFTVDEEYKFPYTFSKMDWRVELPNELKEISGISFLQDNQLLAIQDEAGIFYTVDYQQGTIIKREIFDKDRDYEDVCMDGENIYVLERDGDLYQTMFGEIGDTIIKYETAFSYTNDTEGLCFDKEKNRLLMAPKEGVPDGGELPQNVVGIYAFDLETKQLSLKPVRTVSEREVGQIIGNGGKPHEIKPSGLAVHPLTGNLYILASVGKILIVVNPDNKIMHVELLEHHEFPQPEGICFDEQGNLFISSEGTKIGASFICRYEI